MNCAHSWQVVRKQLWCMTCVALWLHFSSNRSITLSSVHFLYIYHTPLFSFLHFQLKHTVRALPSSLSESDLFSSYIRHRHNSFVHSQIWWVFSFHKSLLPVDILLPFFYFPRLYTPVIISKSARVLGFVVMCRQYLMRRVTSQLSMTGRITRKYTRLVIKTKRVQVKREVRPPLPCPQQMRIWRLLNKKRFLMTRNKH